jgi:hypothetical protein
VIKMGIHFNYFRAIILLLGNLSEERVKILQNKIGLLNKHITELDDEIDRLTE